MPQHALTGLLPFAFSTAPLAISANASPSGPDPVGMMLLWYAVIGVMGLLSAAGTLIAWMEFAERRKERAELRNERKQAGALGGFVTHDTLLKELKAVYAKMAEEDTKALKLITDDMTEVKDAVRGLTSVVQRISDKHNFLEGQLNPISPPGPLPASRGKH